MQFLSAQQVGEHALAFYAAGLLMLLLSATLIYYWHAAWTKKRAGATWQASQASSNATTASRASTLSAKNCNWISSYGWMLLVALVCIFACSAFCYIAWALHARPQLAMWDQTLTGAIATHTDKSVILAFSVITHLGDTLTFTLICISLACALLVYRHYLLAAGCVMAIAGNSILNRSLKAVFERSRPLYDHGFIAANGWSFPSGHTSGSVVVYGILAYIAMRLMGQRWHLPILLLAISLSFTVACSRIFLQVHFASDVVAGFISGSVWLTLCISLMEYWRKRLAKREYLLAGSSTDKQMPGKQA